MRRIWKALIIIILLAALGAGWVWWNQVQSVDMSSYVPADSVVYVEANDLSEILSALGATDAWRSLAPPAGISVDVRKAVWLSRLAKWTGIGPAEAVVLSRAQIAVTVLGVEAFEDSVATLKIAPRFALVAETHCGTNRATAAAEKIIGEFARRTFASPRVERRVSGDTSFVTYTAPHDARRKMIAAVSGSVIIVGNDEAAVEACLSVNRGERQNLSEDARLQQTRKQFASPDSLAFGFVPQGGAQRLLEVAVLPYASQISSNQNIQSLAAGLVPQLGSKLVSVGAWSTRLSGGKIEDRFYIGLPDGLTSRVQTAFAPAEKYSWGVGRLLPADTYQVTQYNYRDPEVAWRGFQSAIASQLDPLSAPFVGVVLDGALKPYGIEKPREFLRAVGPEITTARLDGDGDSTVLIVAARDARVLREQLRRRFGTLERTKKIGAAEMIISQRPDQGVASFVSDYLITGSEESVRRCLMAHAAGDTLAAKEDFRRIAERLPADNRFNVVTYTEDGESTRRFFSRLAARNRTAATPVDAERFEELLQSNAFSVTSTELADGGFIRQTYSSLGQLGKLVGEFALQTDASPTD